MASLTRLTNRLSSMWLNKSVILLAHFLPRGLLFACNFVEHFLVVLDCGSFLMILRGFLSTLPMYKLFTCPQFFFKFLMGPWALAIMEFMSILLTILSFSYFAYLFLADSLSPACHSGYCTSHSLSWRFVSLDHPSELLRTYYFHGLLVGCHSRAVVLHLFLPHFSRPNRTYLTFTVSIDSICVYYPIKLSLFCIYIPSRLFMWMLLNLSSVVILIIPGYHSIFYLWFYTVYLIPCTMLSLSHPMFYLVSAIIKTRKWSGEVVKVLHAILQVLILTLHVNIFLFNFYI